MAKKLLLGSLLAGLVLFAWGAVSWMVLPWHNATFETLDDPQAVETAANGLKSFFKKPGIYLFPSPTETTKERLEEGPFAFISIVPEGINRNIAVEMVSTLANNIIAALLIGLLLLKTSGLNYWQRVGFVVGIVLVASLLCHIPYWNWWKFSVGYTAVTIADLLIAWFLGGLVLAKCCQR